MATRRICEFLDGNKVSYRSVRHTCAYTAQEIAESSHIPGRFMAKVVLVRLDGQLAIAAVPATSVVDLAKLRRETGAAEARLAEEADFRERFSDCQVGTVPPFGNVFGMDTYVDRQLMAGEQFAFNAGTHRDVIVMRFPDYVRVASPRLVDISAEARSSTKKTRRSGEKIAEEVWRIQSADSSTDEALAFQTQCGCEVVCHDGAD